MEGAGGGDDGENAVNKIFVHKILINCKLRKRI